MNLRARKSTLKREKNSKNEGNNLIRLFVYIVIIVSLSFGVFGSTVYFDGQSQRINKQIAIKEKEIYRLQREIQNQRVSFESKSRKEFICDRIEKYGLGLRSPNPDQIVNLNPDLYPIENSTKGERIALNN